MNSPCLNLILIGLFSLTSAQALAGLGEKREAGLSHDQQDLGLAKLENKSVASSKNYTVDQITSENVTVTEYHDRSGTCFAVTWVGSHQPNLKRLLGDFSDEHAKALTEHKKIRGNRRSSHIVSQNLVVDRFSISKTFHGRAYVPGLLPAGVTVDELK